MWGWIVAGFLLVVGSIAAVIALDLSWAWVVVVVLIAVVVALVAFCVYLMEGIWPG